MQAASKSVLSPEALQKLKFWRVSTFWVMLLGYVGYYMVRQNLSAAFPLMESALGYSNTQLGVIAATSEIAYAIGKFINGPLGDKVGGKRIFLLGMAGAILCNFLFAMGTTLAYFIVVWCVCRYFLSMGWGGIAKTIGAWYEPERNGTIMGWISLNFQFGSVIATLFAGMLVGLGYTWDKLFIYPAILVCGVWIWSYFCSKATPSDVIPGVEFGKSETGKQSLANFEARESEGEALNVWSIIWTLMQMPVFRHLLVFSFVTTFLRSIFLFWIPKFLVDIGMGSTNAILKSAIFPFLGCLGTVLLGWYTDKYAKNGDRARAMWIMLLGLFVSLSGVAYLANAGAAYHNIVVVLVGLCGFFLLGPYSMSSGCLTLDIAGSRGAGSCTGLIDGLGYIGGALAAWGAGVMSEQLGWAQVFGTLAGVSLLAIVSAFFMSLNFQRMHRQGLGIASENT